MRNNSLWAGLFHAMRQLVWPRTLAEWIGFLQQSGLQEDAAVRALALGHYAQEYGVEPIYLLSGRRDPAWTAAAQARWDRGDRSGLAVRPATNSSHHSGRAFDIAPAYGRLTSADAGLVGQIGEALGLRWGGRFSTPDPAHFDLP